MSAEAGYGTQPDVLAALLAVIGDAGTVLSYDEDRSFAALSLGRFGSVGSSRLDWSGVEVLHRSPAFDGDGLRGLLRGLTRPDELAVVFWSNLAVPSLALEVGLVARHAEAILECCFACWVYLADSGSLIEFQDGEGFTAGRVPE
ncbi:hypothetical protein TUSST3_81120 [Streptomyces sp. TUS-ST3]|uniref:hypothetical protein n=1 Tax=Streptomyces sp. TUS-ST3 TaxID=3025591 RepID=UPI00235B3DB8|nr:hypothetical protein [Streptomyces sp. TUS-ST3]GLP71492.1 hypothetical protein TUSST3_81120 [Streptomyces sp. TUS-ST3]